MEANVDLNFTTKAVDSFILTSTKSPIGGANRDTTKTALKLSRLLG